MSEEDLKKALAENHEHTAGHRHVWQPQTYSGNPTLNDYDQRATELTGGKCPTCEGVLGYIENYDHNGGWNVEGFQRKQWLYKTCRKCGYQWALWKLGIPR
jgi:hypothetical protein